MTDELTFSRRRQIEEPHLRSVELQILDALLRIEELLQAREEPVLIQGEPADLITNIVPQETPFSEKVAKTAKGRRKDYL